MILLVDVGQSYNWSHMTVVFITKCVNCASGVCCLSLVGSVVVCERQPGTDQKPAQHPVLLQPSVPAHGLPQLHHQGMNTTRRLTSLQLFVCLWLCLSTWDKVTSRRVRVRERWWTKVELKLKNQMFFSVIFI